ncbi:MAG: hypothetical protein RBT34_05510 [Anaerolineaceae bacterium]|nr:hypothetical protein [Anaerolineaceae bacterium]
MEFAHEVICGALEYVEKIGFRPHEDFKKQMADLMIDPSNAHPVWITLFLGGLSFISRD